MEQGSNSPSSLISLLDQASPDVSFNALQALHSLCLAHWLELTPALERLEALSNQASEFGQSCALLVSRIYFYRGDTEKALHYALRANALLAGMTNSADYLNWLRQAAMSKYIELKRQGVNLVGDSLESLVQSLLLASVDHSDESLLLGFALESHKEDLLLHVLKSNPRLVLQLPIDQIPYALENVLNPTQHTMLYAALLAKLGKPQEIETRVLSAIQDSNPGLALQIRHMYGLKSQEEDAIFMHFLANQNVADMAILEGARNFVTSGSSMYNTALLLSNALMHCGTTCDVFLREKIDWVYGTTLWSRFTAVASLGLIHRRQAQPFEMLQSYLPAEGQPWNSTGSEYAEAGALFGLGLMSSSRTRDNVIDFIGNTLVQERAQTMTPVIKHGALLGLIACLIQKEPSQDLFSLVEPIKTILYEDDVTSGEVAGLVLGLLSPWNEELAVEMLSYARETQHDRVTRSLSLGVAMMIATSGEITLIEKMLEDENRLIRLGGAWALGLGQKADKKIIERLLLLVATDVDEEVKRASILALSMLISGDELSALIDPLTASFNPHTRYASALALGLSAKSDETLKTLQGILSSDREDVVKQGTLIALSLQLMQTGEEESRAFRDTLNSCVTSKHEGPLSRFGAVLGMGILDAGGRNCELISGTNRQATLAKLLFSLHWNWYPMALFLGLALKPTGLFLVDAQGRIPDGPTGWLIPRELADKTAYPKPIQPKTEDKPELVTTAVLSVSTRSSKLNPKPEQETVAEPVVKAGEDAQMMQVVEEIAEPFEELKNLHRFLPAYTNQVSFKEEALKPVCPLSELKASWSGVIVVECQNRNFVSLE